MTTGIPTEFTADGVLDVGTYEATIEQVRDSILVRGPHDAEDNSWDAVHRLRLLDSAEILIVQLRAAGISEIFIDGSFAEAKPRPNDIDGYFECTIADLATGDLARRLNGLDPHKIWTWDPAARKPGPESTKKQLPMWHRYRVEFYPHCRGLLSGIKDRFGNEQQFPAAFRQQRGTGLRKGIIKIVPSNANVEVV
jgi:hypothetical protein